MSTLLYHLDDELSSTTPTDFLSLLRTLDSASSHDVSSSQITFRLPGRQGSASIDAAREYWAAGNVVASKLGLRDGETHILINGRLVGPITPKTFAAKDFEVLEEYEHRKRVKPVIDLLKAMMDDMEGLDRENLADLISNAVSIISAAYTLDDNGIFTASPVSRSRVYDKLDNGELSFGMGDVETAVLHVAAVVDPISEQAQRWSSLLRTLAEMGEEAKIAVSVHLTPSPVVDQVKLKRFYRSALSPQLQFDPDGEDVAPPLTFDSLPGSPIYTLGMDTPPAWIVSPESSRLDLDNLMLGNIQDPVQVTFDLKQLLIEGHARESNNAPPRGLQLQLLGRDKDVVSDTQVMANLGYMQFKATPRMYDLAIRPGRGTEVYNLESVGSEGWDSLGVNVTGTRVALASFEGVTLLPRFTRKKGMEMENVLSELPPEEPSLTATVFSRYAFPSLRPSG